MNYEYGEYVRYGLAGICQFVGTEMKNFDGLPEREYCKLKPKNSESSVYYVPKDIFGKKVRKILSKSETKKLIDLMPEIEPMWSNNCNERKNMFEDAVKSDSFPKLISALKGLHMHKVSQMENRKKLTMSDEKYLKIADNFLHQEFAVSLGVPEDAVDDIINNRLATEA